MSFFGKRDLVYFLIIAILLLSVVFLGARCAISDKKYEKYRETILSRAVECSIQLLEEYVESGDSNLASFISSRLNELPLGDEERESVTELCYDISLSDVDSGAKMRSISYASELFAVLTANRRDFCRGNTASFPLYEKEIPTYAQPEEKPYYSSAKRILNESEPRSYSRGNIIGYRTANAYAEFENGKFVRYLCRRVGSELISADEAKKEAEKFAKLYCGGGKVTSESSENGVFTYYFDGFYIVVSPYGGVMRYEVTKN